MASHALMTMRASIEHTLYSSFTTRRYCLGFTSPVGKDMQNDLNITDSQWSLFSAIIAIG